MFWLEDWIYWNYEIYNREYNNINHKTVEQKNVLKNSDPKNVFYKIVIWLHNNGTFDVNSWSGEFKFF